MKRLLVGLLMLGIGTASAQAGVSYRVIQSRSCCRTAAARTCYLWPFGAHKKTAVGSRVDTPRRYAILALSLRRILPMRRKSSLPARLADATVVPWERVAPKSVFPIEKGSRAGVVVDRAGVPRVFVFDTAALLDVLSAIDERLVDQLPDEAYHSKDANPAGWLIDELETKLPLSKAYVQSLKDAIAEAERKGWIPFEAVERTLHLV